MSEKDCLACSETGKCESCEVLKPVKDSKKCGMETEVYSRVCGYHRPIRNWNRGKQEEFKERQVYNPDAHVNRNKLLHGVG